MAADGAADGAGGDGMRAASLTGQGTSLELASAL
jgi:hypothetical protein